MTIITSQLAEKLQENHDLLSSIIVNPRNFSALCSILKEKKEVIIYDITTTTKHPQKTIISVNDHINKTGNNPLVGKQKELNIDFVDITNLYKKKQNGVITVCCGKSLNTQYKYPSSYLCNISIMAKAIGVQRISAFLLNIL